jgi:Serine/threonine protein kinase
MQWMRSRIIVGMNEVVGYRLVRTLGVGTRATVHLAHPVDAGQAVALKIFHSCVPPAEVDREAAVLGSVESEHLIALLDVCGVPGTSPVLVLERLTTTSLAWLLRERRRLGLGEAVTLLVSMARGVYALHTAGYAHGAFGAANVLFAPGNRPVVTGLGHATSLADADGSSARCADWRAVRDVGRAIFDRVDVLGREADVDEVASSLEVLVAGRDRASDHDRLEGALFALAPPAPVALQPPRRREPAGSDGSVDAVRAAAIGPNRAQGRRRAPGRRSETELTTRIGNVLGIVLEHGPASVLRDRAVSLVRTRKRPAIVGAALAALLVLGAVVLLPPSGGAADARPGHVPAAAVPSGNATATISDTPTQHAGTPSPQPGVASPQPGDDEPIRSDDPVAAAEALLRARSQCLRHRSAGCLEAIDEPTSPLYQADAHPTEVSGHTSKGAPDYAEFGVSLIERIGGSALVALAPPVDAENAEPATALVIKGEAGWRLRQIYVN